MNTVFSRSLAAVCGIALAVGAVIMFLLPSCNDNKPDPKAGGEQYETATTGKAEILCDESIADYMQPTFRLFDSSYNEASVTIKPVSAREAMTQLFGTKARGIILSRTYLADEDSLLKANKVPPHAATVIATDALVFAVQSSFPLDTIALDQLKKLFTDQSASLRGMFPNLKTEPIIVCPDSYSSEYGNLLLNLTKNAAPKHPITFVKNSAAVEEEIKKNPNAIGIGYLSRFAGNTNLKMLKIGFQDTTGTYIRPKAVHQSYVVMGKYPLPIKIQGLLLEDRRNLPWGYITFLRNDVRAKEYFLKHGIVPEGARFNLIPEEEN
jgi:ABC-type phosphate transport system substrate-binding protein